MSIKKVVLAYSGGLDTSAIVPWLKVHRSLKLNFLNEEFFAAHSTPQTQPRHQ